jgi:hypothetical protein
MLIDEPIVSKSAVARFVAGVTNTTEAATQNVNRSLTLAGLIPPNGADTLSAIAIFLGALGNSAAKAPVAVPFFMNMRLINVHDAPDCQSGLKARDDTMFAEFWNSLVVAGKNEIRRANWTLTILSNPAAAEFACGAGAARRVFIFMGNDMAARNLVRSAKVVPSSVLAEFAALFEIGDSAETSASDAKNHPAAFAGRPLTHVSG